MHLRHHAIDVLGIDARLDLAEDFDERRAVVRVSVRIGGNGTPIGWITYTVPVDPRSHTDSKSSRG